MSGRGGGPDFIVSLAGGGAIFTVSLAGGGGPTFIVSVAGAGAEVTGVAFASLPGSANALWHTRQWTCWPALLSSNAFLWVQRGHVIVMAIRKSPTTQWTSIRMAIFGSRNVPYAPRTVIFRAALVA